MINKCAPCKALFQVRVNNTFFPQDSNVFTFNEFFFSLRKLLKDVFRQAIYLKEENVESNKQDPAQGKTEAMGTEELQAQNTSSRNEEWRCLHMDRPEVWKSCPDNWVIFELL